MKIIDKAIEKKLNRLRIENPYAYDNMVTPNRLEALQNRFTRTMLVNSVWYAGVDIELKKLYEQDLKAFKIGRYTSDELNYFWAQSTEGTNIRKIHSGIPQLICEKMVDLLLSNGYEYVIEDDKTNQKRLEAILDDNDFTELLGEAIETESWGGGVALKLSNNLKFPYPIMEVIQPEEYEPTVEAGRITEDIFITYYNRNNITYKLKEIYGYGYIKYLLYKHINGDWVTAELSDLDETKELKDITFSIKSKFSIYKPNKLPNSEFKGSRLGESDYAGSHGLFDALDEVVSTLIQEFRDGKIKNFWPSDLLPIDPITKQQYIIPALKKDFITYNSGIGEKEKPTKPELMQGDIHSEKYLSSYKQLLESVLNNAGLSPQTVGVTGLESTAASEESQQLREKTSIRTREKKVGLWEKTLEKLFDLVLKMDDIKNGHTVGDYDINVTFGDYKIESLQDKTATAGAGLVSKSWDLKTAIDYVHDEMTEDEKILIRINSKIENGITIFTKEEEAVYKKMMTIPDTAEVETPEVEEPVVEDEVIEDDIT